MRSELDVLLDKIDDSNLRADIRSQVARIPGQANVRAGFRVSPA